MSICSLRYAACNEDASYCHDIMEYDIGTYVSKVTAASTFTAVNITFTVAKRSDLVKAVKKEKFSLVSFPQIYVNTAALLKQVPII